MSFSSLIFLFQTGGFKPPGPETLQPDLMQLAIQNLSMYVVLTMGADQSAKRKATADLHESFEIHRDPPNEDKNRYVRPFNRSPGF